MNNSNKSQKILGIVLRRLAVFGSLQILTAEVDGFTRGGSGIFSFRYEWVSSSGGYARGVAVCGAGLLYR